MRTSFLKQAIPALLCSAFAAGAVYAESLASPGNNPADDSIAAAVEPWNTGWSFTIDNDVLVSPREDKDYTGGVAATFGGSRIAGLRLSLNPVLSRINRLTGMQRLLADLTTGHTMQIGLLLFTPELDETGMTGEGERPFANLLFIENSQYAMRANGKRLYSSAFAVGILGSPIGEAAQNVVHSIGDIASSGDYGMQISDGGELTARYSASMQTLLPSSVESLQLKYRIEGSIGYLTDASATFAARWGRFGTSWWSFAPSRGNYLPRVTNGSQRLYPSKGVQDFYVWASATVRARAYNAFLQGQFRHSEVTFSSDELNHLLGEFSMGVTRTFGNRLLTTLALHYQTSEISDGPANRPIRWGGLSVRLLF